MSCRYGERSPVGDSGGDPRNPWRAAWRLSPSTPLLLPQNQRLEIPVVAEVLKTCLVRPISKEIEASRQSFTRRDHFGFTVKMID